MSDEKLYLDFPHAILIIEPTDGKIIDANSKAVKTYGYKKEELCNMYLSNLNTVDTKTLIKQLKTLEVGRTSYHYFSQKTASGKVIEMECEISSALSNNKVVLYSILKPSSNIDYLNKIMTKYFSTSPYSIVILDNNLNIINYNKSFDLQFNIKRVPILESKIPDIINIDESKKINAFNTSLLNADVADIDVTIEDKPGNLSYFNMIGIPAFFNKVFCGSVIFFKNKTKQEVEKQKKDLNYKDALNQAKIYQQQKQLFFSRMSHNMRTPLTAILSFSEFGEIENNRGKSKEYFSQIYQSAEYLLSLVNDVLNMNKIESGSIQLKPKPICKSIVLRNIINIIDVFAKEKNIKIITNFDTNMWDYQMFDLIRLEQIYINVLHNAIKYSTEGSTVIWNKYYLQDDKGNPYFRNEVIDEGIGISKDFIKIMFDPYTQEKDTTFDNSEGSGLGLAITKSLIDMLNGRIWCESNVGVGTTIYFVIPACEISKKEYLAYKNKKIISKKIKNKKILICEDNPINRKILDKILSSFGVITDMAENGKVGVDKAKNNDYFAILMDLQMPVMDGYTSTKLIRKFNKQIPIIAISANSFEKDILMAHQVGMNEHLKKPIDKNNLFSVLLKYI